MERSDLSQLSYIDTNSLLNRNITQEAQWVINCIKEIKWQDICYRRDGLPRASDNIGTFDSFLRKTTTTLKSNSEVGVEQKKQATWLLGSCSEDTKITEEDTEMPAVDGNK